MQNESARMPLRIRTNEPTVRGANRTFTRDVTLGRGPAATCGSSRGW